MRWRDTVVVSLDKTRAIPVFSHSSRNDDNEDGRDDDGDHKAMIDDAYLSPATAAVATAQEDEHQP